MTTTTTTTTTRRRLGSAAAAATLAAASLSVGASAFVVTPSAPSRLAASRSTFAPLRTATSDNTGTQKQSTSDAWVKDEFESVGTITETTSDKAADGDDSNDWVRDSFETGHALDVRAVVGPGEVLVYDTTLRDGTQGESVSVSCDDKLKIAARLSLFGVDYIEGGWPGSNPKDAEFFSRAQTELTEEAKSKLSAFGSTRRKGIEAKDDPQLQALVASEAPTVCIVAKSHLWQVTEIIRAQPEENLEMIRESVSYLVDQDRRVFIDLEHFYDGYKHDPAYALSCCAAAAESGARALVLCDTNGGSMPWEIEEMTAAVRAAFPDVTVGVHAHNDCGMAVANSVMAAKSGAGMVQGTINGIGERTGNADLCSIVPSLALHVESKMKVNPNLSNITSLSRYVDETLNRAPTSSAPYVGTSAFAHKGGLHVAAMERSPLSYQHVEPQLVGNEKRILISELSGRQNIMGKIDALGVSHSVADASERATAILGRVKKLESQGYTFEGAEASVELMILHSTRGYCPPFRVLDYSAQVFDSNLDSASRFLAMEREQKGEESTKGKLGEELRKGEDLRKYNGFGSMWENGRSSEMDGATARATIKVRLPNLDAENEDDPFYYDTLEVSDGTGPVDALASALKRALVKRNHPFLASLELVDYKVRILDPESATAAKTRVMIEFRVKGENQDQTWTTVSVDRNVISASLNALVDGFEYALVEHAQSCLLCDDTFE